MRRCAKSGCSEQASATVGLRYAERLVVVGGLTREPDPNLVDLCRPHVERLTPPRGWSFLDQSEPTPAAETLAS